MYIAGTNAEEQQLLKRLRTAVIASHGKLRGHYGEAVCDAIRTYVEAQEDASG